MSDLGVQRTRSARGPTLRGAAAKLARLLTARPEASEPDSATPDDAQPGAGALAEIAALLATAWADDPAAVDDALKSQGLVMHERLEDHHYVSQYFGGQHAWKLHRPMDNREFMELAAQVREHKRTLLYFDRLYVLHQAFAHAVASTPSDQPIEVLEVGVYRGGTSWFLAALGRRLAPGRVRVTSVDTFSGHSAEDLLAGDEGPHKAGKFASTDYASVAAYLAEFPEVDVIEARIQDQAAALAEHRFALVHADVDIYEPTRFTLGFVADRMLPGGVIVADDYGATTCPGARRAVDEFCAARPGRFLKLELQTGQCLLGPGGDG